MGNMSKSKWSESGRKVVGNLVYDWSETSVVNPLSKEREGIYDRMCSRLSEFTTDLTVAGIGGGRKAIRTKGPTQVNVGGMVRVIADGQNVLRFFQIRNSPEQVAELPESHANEPKNLIYT
jgi:hypothetical protein